ncbi:MAG: NAD(P)H-hydrate dehydratase [Cycloclasticus sp.]|nr:MAG: NAD(P)H-hydrate dehydratase [Cycloclasticus sp.]
MLNSTPKEASPLTIEELKKALSPRQKNAHKGDFGHALLIGGNQGYSGAIRLSASAALRIGSGLVSVATREEHAALITMSQPELMCHGVNTASELKRLINRSTVLAIGPGLGQTKWSYKVFETALESPLPIVVDADGLNLLAKEPRVNNNWILTPHPAEAARLLTCTTAEIQANRIQATIRLQKQYGGVVVLKGAGSLIYDGQQLAICNAGNPGMASAGMGDVLTGAIAGLMAQGFSLMDATKFGVLIHATAGDRAAKKGERGLMASDLMQYIRDVVNEY